MSVAFTREEDAESAAADLPDRPVSPHPNLVTASGLAALERALAEARAAYAAARTSDHVKADRTAIARATRDLRYYASRRASARLFEPEAEPDAVVFGRRVTLHRDDGRRQSFRVVGEDEADPTTGSISYMSPVAKAVLGKGVGDRVTVADAKVEIIRVETTEA